MSDKKKSVLVIFKENLPDKSDKWWKKFNFVIAPASLRFKIESYGLVFFDLNDLVEAGSVYEASVCIEELSNLEISRGNRLVKLINYQGYELWWMYYNSLFLYFCLPFTQYKKLLLYLTSFQSVCFYDAPYKSLFSYYLQTQGVKKFFIDRSGLNPLKFFHFGLWLQIFLTILSLPIMIVKRAPIMVFIGDKFDKAKDYDFRMEFIYKELRQRNSNFIEFIRSIESWNYVLSHFFVRRRPVIYSEAVASVSRFFSYCWGYCKKDIRLLDQVISQEINPDKKFKLLMATHHLRNVGDDIWALKIMGLILRIIGVKVSLFTSALERNFQTVLACKVNDIPTVGILHGLASRHYTTYEFLPGFNGDKPLTVDYFGLWSEWWRDYFLKYSKAYRPEQLFISGPMRPKEKETELEFRTDKVSNHDPIKVLFISEQLALPSEVLPYLETLLERVGSDFSFSFRFRPSRDGFKNWLEKNRPELLVREDVKISEGSLQEAIKQSDVVVGSHSTAVLEALFHHRVPILFNTRKWGDYFELKDYGFHHPFFANNAQELIERVNMSKMVLTDQLDYLLKRYFGDPHKNGSQWAIDQIEKLLK